MTRAPAAPLSNRRGGAHRCPAPRRGRLRRRLGALALGPALLGLSVLPVLRPSTDRPARADAVIVLSGDHGERYAIASSLVEEGLVPTLVFVGTPDRPVEDELCQTRGRVEYLCLRPQPDNTRAEARAVAGLVESRRWQKVVVVTSSFHVTRSRLLFRRCLNAEVSMMGGESPYERWVLVRQLPKEWLKVVYTVAVGPGC